MVAAIDYRNDWAHAYTLQSLGHWIEVGCRQDCWSLGATYSAPTCTDYGGEKNHCGAWDRVHIDPHALAHEAHICCFTIRLVLVSHADDEVDWTDRIWHNESPCSVPWPWKFEAIPESTVQPLWLLCTLCDLQHSDRRLGCGRCW
jgi:hypothetical protein